MTRISRGVIILLLLRLLEVRELLAFAGQSITQVNISNFSCGARGNLLCRGNSTTSGGKLKLTPDPWNRSQPDGFYKNTVGIALVNRPFPLINTWRNQSASFSATFSFQIESSRIGVNGQGMAFVLFSNQCWGGSPGGTLGLYNISSSRQFRQKVVAVEFDTHRNKGDIDDNHVGIDIDSHRSVKARSLSPRFQLCSVRRVYAWVDYSGFNSTIEVRVALTHPKPKIPFLTYSLNLLKVFDTKNIWMGFSGTNGKGPVHNFYTVYDLSVTTSLSSDFFELQRNRTQTVSSPPLSSRLNPTGSPTPQPAQREISKKKLRAISIIFLVTVLISVSCGLAFCAWLLRTRTRRSSIPVEKISQLSAGSNTELSAAVTETFRIFRYKELSLATKGFLEDLKLVQEGNGNMYRGEMPGTGQIVAIKRMNDPKQSVMDFLRGVHIASRLRHRNILRLLGFCIEGPGCYLVYEYLPNGSLDKWLVSQLYGTKLSWNERFNIVRGTAAALHYLHGGWRHKVIHMNVKSSNIMLDENINAMLGDFGWVNIANDHQTPMQSGAYPCLAPELVIAGKYKRSTDIFAFGVVILEVACGRKAYDTSLPNDEILLTTWVRSCQSQNKLFDTVDPRLEGEYDKQKMEVLLRLGLLCCHPDPNQRPRIGRIVSYLEGSVDLLPSPSAEPGLDNLQCYQSPSRRESCLRSSPDSSGEITAQTETTLHATLHHKSAQPSPSASVLDSKEITAHSGSKLKRLLFRSKSR